MTLNKEDHKKLQLKKQLFEHCHQYIEGLLKIARDGIHQSQEDAKQEGKSSAGDKFETHRAMMHLQLEGFIRRLEVAESLERQLISTPHTRIVREVAPGAVVETDRGVYFIAVSAPPLNLDSEKYICLSVDAPLYRALVGQREGELVEWRSTNGEDDFIDIISIF